MKNISIDGKKVIKVQNGHISIAFPTGIEKTGKAIRKMLKLLGQAEKEEERQRYHEKVDNALQKITVCKRDLCADNLSCLVQLCGAEHCFEVGQVDVSGDKADKRGDNVGDEGRDDLSECRTDHNAECHVDDISLHGEFLKV